MTSGAAAEAETEAGAEAAEAKALVTELRLLSPAKAKVNVALGLVWFSTGFLVAMAAMALQAAVDDEENDCMSRGTWDVDRRADGPYRGSQNRDSRGRDSDVVSYVRSAEVC